MATSKGVIQGHTGATAVDYAHQIIVDAQAHGTGSEPALLLPVVTAVHSLRSAETLITADADYHSEANPVQLETMQIPARIAANELRRRDERFATQERYTVPPDSLYDKSDASPPPPVFAPSDFMYNVDARTCVCPARTPLYGRGRSIVTNGFVGEHSRGAKRECARALFARCLRTPGTTAVRNVAFFRGRIGAIHDNQTARMKARIDTPAWRMKYGRHLATAEPLFANLCYNKQLDRFTLRGRVKVDANRSCTAWRTTSKGSPTRDTPRRPSVARRYAHQAPHA
jgi:hypothetical protein